jgi:hypothetical protein
MYVNGGHVVTTVNISKILSDYGGNYLDKGIFEKLKEKGRAWPFYIATKKLKP